MPNFDSQEWLGNQGIQGFAQWRVSVKAQPMPDGELRITGLRIEPLADYDGSMRDQIISTELLRKLPLKMLLLGFCTARALMRGDMDEFDRELIKSRQEEDHYLRGPANSEVITKKDKHQARLKLAAKAYTDAIGHPQGIGPREQVSRVLGVSTSTVDRLLREARQLGLLAPYAGTQGKYGKSDPKVGEK